MDLYRYFHPHHNPRLRTVALRHQELGELEQAARELKNAIKRAEIRSANAGDQQAQSGIPQAEQFSDVLAALEFVVTTLGSLTSAHPGDSRDTMQALLKERYDAPGWENWTRLLQQRLELVRQHDEPTELDRLRCPPTVAPYRRRRTAPDSLLIVQSETESSTD
ncbi:MAG: hypothetical protein KDD69_01740 [Bdellovibrionales bacterium]|nr:hypothetical protein [Bdellovibrionales bacterium]